MREDTGEEVTSSENGAEEDDDTSIKIDRVDHDRLLTWAKKIKVPLPKGAEADTEVLVNAVQDHVDKVFYRGPKKVPCARCDCNAIVPESLEICPFCGDVARPDGDDEQSSVIGGGLSEQDSAGTVTRGKKFAEERKEKGLSVLATKAAVVPPPKKGMAPANEDDLEDAVGRLQQLKRSWEQNAWDIGEQLIRLTQEAPDRPALWRLRKEDDGVKARYKTFKEFLRAEVGISNEMAATCVYLAKEFKREQVPVFAMSKVSIVLNAPEPERKALLAKAGAMPQRQLIAHVRELNIAHGKHEKKRAARQARARKEHAVKDEKAGITTFVFPGKKLKIALYRASKDAHGKFVAATSVTDAWGWIEGQNGVQLVFKLEKSVDGKLRALFEAKRAD